MNSGIISKNEQLKESKNIENLKSDFFLIKIIDLIKKNKLLEIMKYNKIYLIIISNVIFKCFIFYIIVLMFYFLY